MSQRLVERYETNDKNFEKELKDLNRLAGEAPEAELDDIESAIDELNEKKKQNFERLTKARERVKGMTEDVDPAAGKPQPSMIGDSGVITFERLASGIDNEHYLNPTGGFDIDDPHVWGKIAQAGFAEGQNKVALPGMHKLILPREFNRLTVSQAFGAAGADDHSAVPAQIVMPPTMQPESDRPTNLLDILTRIDVDSRFAWWMHQRQREMAVNSPAEGAAHTESKFAYETTSRTLASKGHIAEVSEDAWNSAPYLQETIQTDMVEGIRQSVESDLISGSGAQATNLVGFKNYGTALPANGVSDGTNINATPVDTATVSADGVADGRIARDNINGIIGNVRRGIRQVKWGRGASAGYAGRASHVLVHPNVMEKVDNLQVADADRRRIFGDPSMPGPMTMWGVPIIETDALDDGDTDEDMVALVGNFTDFARMLVYGDVVVEKTNVVKYERYVYTLRCRMICQLALRRATAFFGVRVDSTTA